MKESISSEQHYFFHRTVYCLVNGHLESQIKTFFVTDQYNVFNKGHEAFAKRILDLRLP
jgi:hypothetical protein